LHKLNRIDEKTHTKEKKKEIDDFQETLERLGGERGHLEEN
jgi:hypothetical protein